MDDSSAVDPKEPSAQSLVLRAVLRVMQPLVRWLVRSGVGYSQFSAALKPVFLEQARQEVQSTGGKTTDSALSLLSGLHRKDVRLAGIAARAAAVQDAQEGVFKASLPAQVVARWLASDLPDALPLSGADSFESLVRSVSTDLHPRALQAELERLGVVALRPSLVQPQSGRTTSDGAAGSSEHLALLRHAFTPDNALVESQHLLSMNLHDHIAAGVHNLSSPHPRKFLEQAVFADGLTPASVRQLELLAGELWQQAMHRMVQAAVPLCEQDALLGGDQRLRMGLFCYAEAQAPSADTPTSDPTNPQKPTL